MSADDTSGTFGGETAEPTEPTSSESPVSGPNETSPTAPKTGWRRRTFLQAAALGTAAAALIGNDGGGLGKSRLGPIAALAAGTTDPGTWQCTANDVNLASGQALNVPCACNGSFNAQVQFSLVNNTGTNRYCVAVYLPATAGVAAQWVLLKASDGTSTLLPGTHTLIGTVAGFPCGVPQITFTNATVAWQTSTTAATCDPNTVHFSKSQCEHQNLTIIGYGAALACASAACAGTGNSFCTVNCGGSLYLQGTAAGASAGATAGSYTWTLKDPSNSVVGTATGSSPQCFTVANPSSGTYTLEVQDSVNCKTTATIPVTVNTLTTPVVAAGSPACDGTVQFTMRPDSLSSVFITGEIWPSPKEKLQKVKNCWKQQEMRTTRNL
jgi:hypothetical protein